MIKTDISRCTGCRMCETACSFSHSKQTNRNISRIKVSQHYDLGIDGPVVCQQCRERYCVNCPQKAISIGNSGQILINREACNSCGKCVRLCPIGAIEIFNNIVLVCDTCNGNPSCVDVCTEKAISFSNSDNERSSLSQINQKTLRLKSREKQAKYIHLSGIEMRKKWRINNE
ncbi:MAG: 4Fe-4S dicluster domain-containing protein [Bacteroidales bacterium]|nr:4Fe-4S dicluster domain-containing protein [Bacteroidales bacterium]